MHGVMICFVDDKIVLTLRAGNRSGALGIARDLVNVPRDRQRFRACTTKVRNLLTVRPIKVSPAGRRDKIAARPTTQT
jgi:hypothetical protein